MPSRTRRTTDRTPSLRWLVPRYPGAATEPRAMGYVPSSFVDDTVRTVVRFRWPPSL